VKTALASVKQAGEKDSELKKGTVRESQKEG